MRSASVGFQCPECVAEGAKTVRAPRTAFGGRVTGDTSRVTLTLIAANVAAHLVGLTQTDLVARFGAIGYALGPEGFFGIAAGESYRLLTSAFLHANLFHLLVNMLALAAVGPQLESALGRVRYLALYVLSALGGSTLSYLLTDPQTYGVGASGAIYGLFGAFYVVERRLGGETGSIVALLAVNLVITFAVPIIDWRAHLGGLATGALLAAAFAYAPRGPRRDVVQAVACAGVIVVLVVLIVSRTAHLAA